MSYTTAADRVATRTEVLDHRGDLRRLVREHGLGSPSVTASGTIVVHSDEPGYRAVRRFATVAAGVVGAWVKVITDDIPDALGDLDAL